jgi:hypothetical protein
MIAPVFTICHLMESTKTLFKSNCFTSSKEVKYIDIMKRYFKSALLFAFLIPGCSPQFRTFSDYNKYADISTLKAYQWLSAPEIEAKGLNPLYYNELNDERIKRAANAQIQRRGFIESDTSRELQFHYHIIVDDKSIVETETTRHLYMPLWNLRSREIYPYKEGTLIIDLMDTRTNSLVWRGWASGVIEGDVVKHPEESIQNAVAKIFEKFPYRR